jgi:hypothetical protein
MAGVAWARSAGGTARRDHELIPIGDSWNPLETSSARGDRLEPKVRIELTAYALPRRSPRRRPVLNSMEESLARYGQRLRE